MGTKGQRLAFRAGGAVALEDHEFPDPAPQQMLVRVTRSQISAGSELNGYRALLAQRPDAPDRPVARGSGYTTVGRVVAVGRGVTDFREGDRVLTFGSHASHCLAEVGDPDPARSYPDVLPAALTDEQACYGILGDVALHSIRRAGLQLDESVAVFGAGVVGQLTVQLARLSGAHPIVAIDLYASRLELARRGGATHVADASQGDGVPEVVAATAGGAQTVFHCSPVAQLLEATLRAAAPRGTIVLTGSAPGTATIGLQVDLLRRELTVVGSYEAGLNVPHAYWPWTRQRNRATCYRLIASGQLQVDMLTSHVVPPARAEEMYRMMAAGGEEWMSVIFAWE